MFKRTDANKAKLHVENGVTAIRNWLISNEQKLNQDKTEIMLICSKYRLPLPSQCFNIGNETLLSDASARNM